ncbi:C2 family cysteine protease [Streptomyces sp. NPDC002537]
MNFEFGKQKPKRAPLERNIRGESGEEAVGWVLPDRTFWSEGEEYRLEETERVCRFGEDVGVIDYSNIVWGTLKKRKALGKPLYGKGGSPVASDVNQRYLGDCFLLASMAAIANRHPDHIKGLIKEVDGQFMVRLCNLRRGSGWVTVSRSFYVNSDPREDSAGAEYADIDGPLWPAVIEKAIAGGRGGYGALMDGGNPASALRWLGFQDADSKLLDGLSSDELVAEFNKPAVHIATTKEDEVIEEIGLETGHAYSVLSCDQASNKVNLRDPYGKKSKKGEGDGVFEIGFDELLKAFECLYWASHPQDS